MGDDDGGDDTQADTRSTGSRAASDLSSFTALLLDFYRGEVDRATTWRTRLDQTTNWAVVVVAAVLTWAFSGDDRPHYVILIGAFAVTAFLFMEATRYREYDVWRSRVRTVQTGLIAEALAPEEQPDDSWQTRLGAEFRNPTLQISFWEAMNHRLRRSYLALLTILVLAWIARVTVYDPDQSWRQTAGILFISGEIVVGGVALFYVFLTVVTAWSARGERTEEFQA
jgi:uncharacterized membrane protein